MSNRAMRSLVGLLALVTLTAAGCGGKAATGTSGGTSSPPAGVKAQVWNDFCKQNVALTRGIQQALNGTLSAGGFTPLLSGIEGSLTKDANSTVDPTKTQFQTLVTAVDSVKVAVSTGVEPDYTQITAALNPIPTCNK